MENSRMFTIVEYPGLVKNVDKALSQLHLDLNTPSLWNQAPEARNNEITLALHPEQIIKKQLQAFVKPKKGVLIKVKTSKSQPDAKPEISVVGTVSSVISFPYLSDFFIPMENIIGVDSLTDIETDELVDPVHLCIPPPFFTNLDTIQPYNFTAPTVQLQEKSVGESMQAKVVGVPRKRDITVSEIHAISFDVVEVPTEDSFKSTQKYLNEPLLVKIKALFEKRPVWSQIALFNEFEEEQIPLALDIATAFSYSFVSGPWRNLLIRLGYDPRVDPESRFLQLINIRTSAEELTNFIPFPPSRIFKTNIMDSNIALRNLKTRLYSNHTFSMPPVLQYSMYQLTDIDHPAIVDLLLNTPRAASCDKTNGWFTKQFMERVRTLMHAKIESWKQKSAISGENCLPRPSKRTKPVKNTTTSTPSIDLNNIEPLPLSFFENLYPKASEDEEMHYGMNELNKFTKNN